MNTGLLWLRARKVIESLTDPACRRGIPLNVFASIEHDHAFRGDRFSTIVDIGANRGQFALLARSRFPAARLHLFEPLANCVQTLEALFAADNLVKIHDIAIGPYEHSAEMHVAAEDDSSSLLPIGEEQQRIFGTALRRNETISVAPLASALKRTDLLAPALLKIDVQGFELPALNGCAGLLDLFQTIYVECSFIELYVGQALVTDIVMFLRQHGFSLRGVFNQWIDPKRGPVQADFRFDRDPNASN
jgi:FkbM family methyltransferase